MKRRDRSGLVCLEHVLFSMVSGQRLDGRLPTPVKSEQGT